MIYYQNQEKINYLLNFYTLNQIEKYSKGSQEKIDELWNLSQPQEVPISSLHNNLNDFSYFADSPDGWVPIEDCIKKEIKPIFEIKTENGFSVKASDDHLFQNNLNEWIFTRDLNLGESLITEKGNSKVSAKISRNNEEVYDLSIGHPNHRYFTAGICSHNSGKSLFLQNLALNWVQMGLNVVYITLELSEELVGLRFDAMITELPTKQIFKNMNEAALKLGVLYKTGTNGVKWGKLQIKKLNGAGTTVNDIRAYLKEYEIQSGIKIDALLVDYLDLLHPNSNKIDPSNLFAKDKYTSEELRSLIGELNILGATASQLGRSSIQEQDFDMSHIAGGISKINTADNVLAIFSSASMRERGEYQIQFLKTRSSSGVGSKIYLQYNVENLRITDAIHDIENRGSISTLQQQLTAKKASSNTISESNQSTDAASLARAKIRALAAASNNN